MAQVVVGSQKLQKIREFRGHDLTVLTVVFWLASFRRPRLVSYPLDALDFGNFRPPAQGGNHEHGPASQNLGIVSMSRWLDAGG